jgi:hypothetical protein
LSPAVLSSPLLYCFVWLLTLQSILDCSDLHLFLNFFLKRVCFHPSSKCRWLIRGQLHNDHVWCHTTSQILLPLKLVAISALLHLCFDACSEDLVHDCELCNAHLRIGCILLKHWNGLHSGCQSLVCHHLVILIQYREISGKNLVMLVLFLKEGKVLLQPPKPNPFCRL